MASMAWVMDDASQPGRRLSTWSFSQTPQFSRKECKAGEYSEGTNGSKIRVIINKQSGPKNSPGRVDRH